MQNSTTEFKKERLSFFVNADLVKKLSELSEESNLSLSDIAREALKSYLEKIEKEITDKELEDGYKANYDYYLKSQSEWDYADKE
jgi:metal-responsive CopG/Arc/MetJ family transcriptional regulator